MVHISPAMIDIKNTQLMHLHLLLDVVYGEVNSNDFPFPLETYTKLVYARMVNDDIYLLMHLVSWHIKL